MQVLNIAATLNAQIVDAGVPIISLSIGSSTDKSTWTVQPPDLQSAAQPIIDAFDTASQELAFQWWIVRGDRDQRLYACDWTQSVDTPLTAGEVGEWATYREALRNVPEAQSDPFAIVWPDPPFVINPPPT
jgi:hypothetical protein